MSQSIIKLVSALLAGATVPSVMLVPATAEQFSDGRTFFDHPPSLIRATTSNPATRFSSTYEFTLTIPASAGASLQAVTISQESVADTVRFDVGRTVAFAGNRYGVGDRLPLASTGGCESRNHKQTTIVFNPPVQPGTTVTIALEASRNPDTSGIYLFGVTAYPAGERGNGLFLGYGRLTFHDQSG